MAEHLTAVTRTQGNNRALKEAAVVPAGFPLAFEEVPVLTDAFRRMVRELAYDVCEMALTTYLTAREHGVRFTALPVFLVRGFHHGAILVRRDGVITEPAQLAGRRVGVSRGYTVTTGVWARAIMAAEYGLDLDRVTWVLSGDEHVAAYVPPPNVVPAGPGRKLGQMLLDGEVDAVIGAAVDSPDVAPLIPGAEAAAVAALRDRGLYPINHLVVVRDEVLERHPEAAGAIFEAFAESKRRYVAGLRSGAVAGLRSGAVAGLRSGAVAGPRAGAAGPGAGAAAAPDAADRLHARVMEVTGWPDPLPYGIEPNRQVLDYLVAAARAQHILRTPVDLDALFAPAVRRLAG
jgi:4,5-dihydroxyphthalate decarboxylase